MFGLQQEIPLQRCKWLIHNDFQFQNLRSILSVQAMHEYAIKLELKEGVSQTQSEELEYHEDRYNRLMNDLTELKEIKMQKSNELTLKKQDTAFELEKVKGEIEKLRKEKDYLIQRQQTFNKENEDRAQKIDHLFNDIAKK